MIVIFAEIQGFPRIANHATLMLFTSCGICLAFAISTTMGRNFPVDLVKNGLRGLAVVLYFYVGFHKINTGFLDPINSCATWFHSRIETEILGGNYDIPDFVIRWSPLYVITAELLVATLLIFQRTWLLGLIIALPIHLYVSLAGFTDFSSFMHAVMILFLPVWFWKALSLNPFYTTLVKSSIQMFGLGVAAYSAFSVFALNVWYWDYWTAELAKGVILNVLVFEFCLVILYIWIRSKNTDNGSGIWPNWKPVHSLFIVFVFSWGALPYIFGSQGSLTMFSNLVTQNDRSNHLLIHTEWSKVIDFEKDLVFVRSFDNADRIQGRDDLQGYYLPEREWRWLVHRAAQSVDSKIGVTLEINGQIDHFPDVTRSDFVNAKPISNWLSFRKIDPIGPAKCRW